MGLFAINTKSANTGFTSVTTSATAGTYVQLPSQLCDEVLVSGGLATSISLAGNATPAGAAISTPGAALPFLVKTGGNLSNLWITNSAAAAMVVGLMWIQYKPIT